MIVGKCNWFLSNKQSRVGLLKWLRMRVTCRHSRMVNTINIKNIIGYADESCNVIKSDRVDVFENLAKKYLVGDGGRKALQKWCYDFRDQ
jgi:hypothetical protein